MNNSTLEILEYNKILDILSSFSKTYIGKNLISELQPSFSSAEVSNRLLQTNQAVDIINKYGAPPIGEFNDISVHLKKLDSQNILSPKEILDLTSVLKMSRELYSFFDELSKSINFDFNILKPLFNNLYINLNLEREVFSKIIDENTIDDRASDTLYSIRRAQKTLEQNIKDKLNHFIHSPTYSKYLMDPIITIRDNRYVIPVKDEYRNNINGLIHDISSSGSTVFIEPTIVFNMNNEISTLKIKENIEIEKILSNISTKFSLIINELENNVRLLGRIDFIFAKAKYSISINGILPKINEKKEFNLIKARHPLIDKNIVVPIDLSLGTTYSTLVITGPNTGGKTVSLKTVGLLHLMAYSGIMIPANENSSIFIFDNIFADIGDNQSISESLSTFSSHIKTIINITNHATCQSLILVDELGSGTDPIEGSSLAISILEFFHNLGALCISTTHYQEIKNYALTHDGYINASAEFDVENLKPTYHIILGIPGKSNAFAISQKLGLNKKILDRAISLVDSNDIKIEDILKNIYDTKSEIEKQKEKIDSDTLEIEKLKLELQKDNKDVKDKEKEIIENAKIEARDILLKAKDDSTKIIKQMNDILGTDTSSKIKDLNNLRNDLNTSLRNINSSDNSINLAHDKRNNHILLFAFYFSIFLIFIGILLLAYFIITMNIRDNSSKDLVNSFSVSCIYSNSSDYMISNFNNYSNIGSVSIEKLNINYPILSTCSEETLKIAPCRFAGGMPNEIGNLCIAGHNYANGSFFAKISSLNLNDEIFIYDIYGNSLSYMVYDKYETSNNDISCTSQDTNNKRVITLMTCNSLKDTRIIVKAVANS